MTAIGDRIIELREEQEMTLDELAASLPITASTLGQIERGEIEVPSEPVIEALASALEVPIQSLIDLLPEPEDENEEMGRQRHQRKIVVFSLKEFDSDRGTFSGYGSTFGNVDSGNDRVIEGAFKNSLESFRAKGQLPAMFWAHDWTEPVGEWLDMNEDSKGLQVKGALWVDGNSLGRTPIEKAEQVRNLLTSNGPKGLSIGYDVQKSSFTTEGDKKRVRNLERVKLFEVSPVPFGMNVEATVTAAKALNFVGALPTKKRELEMHLRDVGLSRRDAKRLISGGWSALVRDDEAGLAKALQKLQNTIRGG